MPTQILNNIDDVVIKRGHFQSDRMVAQTIMILKTENLRLITIKIFKKILLRRLKTILDIENLNPYCRFEILEENLGKWSDSIK